MCISPINLKKETAKQCFSDNYHMQQVPCGRCYECRKVRVNSWFVRLYHEFKTNLYSTFLTLTYNDDNIRRSENTGYPSLNYSDIQLMFKRVRKSCKVKFSYFCAGEYGSKTFRPHYHMLIFTDDVDAIPAIYADWVANNGHVHVGQVSEASIYYTLKYCYKSRRSIDYDFYDIEPEKARMSKGLGHSLMTDSLKKYFRENPSAPFRINDKQRISLPRYYRDKIFDVKEKVIRLVQLEPYINSQLELKTLPEYIPRIQKQIKLHEEKSLSKL